MCTAVLIGWDPATPSLPPHLDSYYEGVLLVSKDRRHLLVTPWVAVTIYVKTTVHCAPGPPWVGVKIVYVWKRIGANCLFLLMIVQYWVFLQINGKYKDNMSCLSFSILNAPVESVVKYILLTRITLQYQRSTRGDLAQLAYDTTTMSSRYCLL